MCMYASDYETHTHVTFLMNYSRSRRIFDFCVYKDDRIPGKACVAYAIAAHISWNDTRLH